MHVLTQLSVPSNFEKPKRKVQLLGRIRYIRKLSYEVQKIFAYNEQRQKKMTAHFAKYHIDPKYLDRLAWPNSVDPDQYRVFSVFHSSSNF